MRLIVMRTAYWNENYVSIGCRPQSEQLAPERDRQVGALVVSAPAPDGRSAEGLVFY
jgi:hypothetical protein